VTGSRMREEMQAEEDAILTGRIHNWHDDTPTHERELERPMRHVHEAAAEAMHRLWKRERTTLKPDELHRVRVELRDLAGQQEAQGEPRCHTCKGTGVIPVGGNPNSRDPQEQPDMDDCPVCSR
jgi:hypothetical protein